jgi:inorganic pyrophosphatase
MNKEITMSFHAVPLRDKSPENINAVIEIPRGSHHKYEYDEKLDEIRLDRVLHSPVFYPTDYGFIPETRSEDGDHLDVLVLITEPLFPGCIVSVLPIGVLDMEDNAGQDWKILAVATTDPKLKKIKDISDVDEHYIQEIQHFFEVYKHLEKKYVKVQKWLPKKDALTIITEAHHRFVAESMK